MHDDRAMIRGRNARKRALHRSGVSISLSRLSDRTIASLYTRPRVLTHACLTFMSNGGIMADPHSDIRSDPRNLNYIRGRVRRSARLVVQSLTPELLSNYHNQLQCLLFSLAWCRR